MTESKEQIVGYRGRKSKYSSKITVIKEVECVATPELDKWFGKLNVGERSRYYQEDN